MTSQILGWFLVHQVWALVAVLLQVAAAAVEEEWVRLPGHSWPHPLIPPPLSAPARFPHYKAAAAMLVLLLHFPIEKERQKKRERIRLHFAFLHNNYYQFVCVWWIILCLMLWACTHTHTQCVAIHFHLNNDVLLTVFNCFLCDDGKHKETPV